MSAVASLVIYAIYIVPILVYDTITNKIFFVNANVFIISTVFSLILLRYLLHKRLVSEVGLQYDLDQQKKHLEDLVAERTKELRKSEAMLNTLFENANDGIVIMEADGTIINVNQKACEIHGADKKSLIGTNIERLEVEGNRRLWRERMERLINGEALLFETVHYRKDGSRISLEVSSKAIEIDGRLLIQSFHRDITEKKRLHAQLLHSQKMESIGTLAGGIAHDFNNILTSILGYTDLIFEHGNVSPEMATKLRVIESSARKGSIMVSKLLSFARRGVIEAAPFNINSVIEDTLEMLARLIPKDISIEKDLDNSIPPVKGDVGQIEQILMNLVINAKDAMPDGGRLAIKTSLVELGGDSLRIAADVKEGPYINLTISDTGAGIPEEHIHRIFEPFFTTKEKGKGTGLGLAMVYGIVKEHEGYITVDSTLGKGTTFNIYLPAVEHFDVAGAEADLGAKTILVIDDEIPVLETIRETLVKSGFNVIINDNPIRGLEYFKEYSSRIDLVITDIVMPMMDGAELIRNLREVDPDVKIVATTGFSKDIGNVAVEGFLKKPFLSSKLLSVVREVLENEYR